MAKLEGMERKAFLALERHLIKALQDATPKKTTNASERWRIEPIGDMKFRLFNDVGYLGVLEEGSKPHIIRAKNKKFLRFKKPAEPARQHKRIPGNIAFEKDGFIFSKAVMHPGVEGHFFVKRIMEDKPLWDKIMNEMLT